MLPPKMKIIGGMQTRATSRMHALISYPKCWLTWLLGIVIVFEEFNARVGYDVDTWARVTGRHGPD